MWRVAALACALLAVAAAIPAIRHLREVPSSLPSPVRAQLAVRNDVLLGSGNDVLDAAFSPDGRELVFVGTMGGRVQLWRHALGSNSVRALDGTDGAAMPAWKPGAGAVAFFAAGNLLQIDLASGNITSLAAAPAPAGAAWLPDGSLLYAPDATGPIRRMTNGRTAEATALAAGDRRHAFPSVTTNGFVYVAVRANGSRVVRAVIDGGTHELTATDGHAEIQRDTLIYVRNAVLLAQRMDPVRHSLVGPATPLASEVGSSADGRSFFASAGRMLVWAGSRSALRDLAWYDMTGRRVTTVSDAADMWQVALSPNDGDAAVSILDSLLRTLDIFIVPTSSRGRTTRVSVSLSADTDPIWSPDGQRVLFRTLQNGRGDVWSRRIRNDAIEEPVLRAEPDETASDWRDNTILFHAAGPRTGLDIWALDTRRQSRMQVTHEGFNEWDGHWSPDGRWMAYVSDQSGEPNIYLRPWPDGTSLFRVSNAGGRRPTWGRNGRTLYFLRGTALMRVRLDDTRGVPSVGAPEVVMDVPGMQDYAPAHKSDRILVLAAVKSAETTKAQMIVDWPSLLPSASTERP